MHALRASWPGARGLYRSGARRSADTAELGGSQFAAAISYRALFSLVPLATFAATILAAVLEGDDAARQDVVDAISTQLHLSETGTVDLDTLVSSVPSPWSLAGLISLGLALWGATGVMSSIQKTLAVVFDDGATRQLRARPARQRAARPRRARADARRRGPLDPRGAREAGQRRRSGRSRLGALRRGLPLRRRRAARAHVRRVPRADARPAASASFAACRR